MEEGIACALREMADAFHWHLFQLFKQPGKYGHHFNHEENPVNNLDNSVLVWFLWAAHPGKANAGFTDVNK